MIPEQFIKNISPMMNYSLIQKTWMQRNLEPICKKYRLKISDLSLLLLLHVNREIHTAADVAKYSELKRGNICFIVELLTCRGFIRQEEVEGDRRRKNLVITSEADALLSECDDVINEHLKVTFEGINKEELEKCQAVFMRMYENLMKSESKAMEAK